MVATIDFDQVFQDITSRLEADQRRRIQPGRVRFWDGNWNLRGECHQEYSLSATFIENDTGTAQIELPLDYYITKWLVDVEERGAINVHMTVDKDGARWSGRMDQFQIIKDQDGQKMCRVIFRHDMEELKHVLAWSNPWLPLMVQFPKVWALFGRTKWACKVTLLANLMRLERSPWRLPSNPLHLLNWSNLDMSNWAMVVAPDLEPDRSTGGLVASRFKTVFDATKTAMENAQLTWTCRRYLEGDEPPWPGANLRHGCLVWDIEDNSGWDSGTAFRGSLFSGFMHEMVSIGADGMMETVHEIPDPEVPDLYKTPGRLGSHPSMPGVVFREGETTGIQSSEFTYKPPTNVQFVGGGSSAPMVNELIGATIQSVGDLTAMIPGAPPLGGVADTLLKPLYTDVFLAFLGYKDNQRANRLGWSHYKEGWAEGADRAYTLSWILSMRKARWASRETRSQTLQVADGAPWKIGQNGYGHFFIGSRVAYTVLGLRPGRLRVDRVSELTLHWDRDTSPSWEIVIGEREAKDPIIEAFERLEDMLSLVKDLGLI